MDPLVVFDCEKVLPNRFAVTLAAAARCRALRRGARPRSQASAADMSELALREIAEGAFTPVELARLLCGTEGARLLPASALEQQPCLDAPHGSAAATASRIPRLGSGG